MNTGWKAGAVTAVMLFITACSAGDVRQCRVNADCASGVCLADGTCGEATPSPTATATPAACVPNHDGMLHRNEFPLQAGLQANYETGADVTVDTAGSGASPHVVWSLPAELGGEVLPVALLDPAEQWFGRAFPQGTYAAPLSVRDELLGVFQLTEDTLWLVGLVSPAGGAARTELTYDPPVALLRFPIVEGLTWSADAELTGVFEGLPVGFTTESYLLDADARGTLQTPAGDYPVFRVRSALTRTVGLQVTTQTAVTLMSECAGTTARMVSQPNEPNAEFTMASEVWRLSP